jgi:hypothetical protein
LDAALSSLKDINAFKGKLYKIREAYQKAKDYLQEQMAEGMKHRDLAIQYQRVIDEAKASADPINSHPHFLFRQKIDYLTTDEGAVEIQPPSTTHFDKPAPIAPQPEFKEQPLASQAHCSADSKSIDTHTMDKQLTPRWSLDDFCISDDLESKSAVLKTPVSHNPLAKVLDRKEEAAKPLLPEPSAPLPRVDDEDDLSVPGEEAADDLSVPGDGAAEPSPQAPSILLDNSDEQSVILLPNAPLDVKAAEELGPNYSEAELGGMNPDVAAEIRAVALATEISLRSSNSISQPLKVFVPDQKSISAYSSLAPVISSSVNPPVVSGPIAPIAAILVSENPAIAEEQPGMNNPYSNITPPPISNQNEGNAVASQEGIPNLSALPQQMLNEAKHHEQKVDHEGVSPKLATVRVTPLSLFPPSGPETEYELFHALIANLTTKNDFDDLFLVTKLYALVQQRRIECQNASEEGKPNSFTPALHGSARGS